MFSNDLLRACCCSQRSVASNTTTTRTAVLILLKKQKAYQVHNSWQCYEVDLSTVLLLWRSTSHTIRVLVAIVRRSCVQVKYSVNHVQLMVLLLRSLITNYQRKPLSVLYRLTTCQSKGGTTSYPNNTGIPRATGTTTVFFRHLAFQ